MFNHWNAVRLPVVLAACIAIAASFVIFTRFASLPQTVTVTNGNDEKLEVEFGSEKAEQDQIPKSREYDIADARNRILESGFTGTTAQARAMAEQLTVSREIRKTIAAARRVGLEGKWTVLSVEKSGEFSEAQIGQQPNDIISIEAGEDNRGPFSFG